ncbi:hypothetical protein GIS00_01070 [Nakamurella sp. YIM 132087]|uniref:Uncharacterized protein n=1 Tax=Nakamurella alba TaxID=2665158 RepID=A0A7K1FEK2_9ACTN|nr:hypothetical protein [Nakamurella alba]MTD12535.1 hypothetical protein [Nakamurella alba]
MTESTPVEAYADLFTVILRPVDDPRFGPDHVDGEVIMFEFRTPDALAPVDAIRQDIQMGLGDDRFVAQEVRRQVSWGADSQTWSLIIDIAAQAFETIATAGMGIMAERIIDHVRRKRDAGADPLTEERTVERAKRAVAIHAGVPANRLETTSVMISGDKLEATIEVLDTAPGGRRYELRFRSHRSAVTQTYLKWTV